MKKSAILALTLALLCALCACSPANPLIGTWSLATGDGADFGEVISFDEEGNFACSSDDIVIDNMDPNSEEYQQMLLMLSGFAPSTYVVKDASTVTIKVADMFGTDTSETDYAYAVDGNTLTLGASTYTRTK